MSEFVGKLSEEDEENKTGAVKNNQTTTPKPEDFDDIFTKGDRSGVQKVDKHGK